MFRSAPVHVGKTHYLGSAFESEEAAARAYDAAAREHLGPNPAVNFPVPGSGETQARKKKKPRKLLKKD